MIVASRSRILLGAHCNVSQKTRPEKTKKATQGGPAKKRTRPHARNRRKRNAQQTAMVRWPLMCTWERGSATILVRVSPRNHTVQGDSASTTATTSQPVSHVNGAESISQSPRNRPTAYMALPEQTPRRRTRKRRLGWASSGRSGGQGARRRPIAAGRRRSRVPRCWAKVVGQLVGTTQSPSR